MSWSIAEVAKMSAVSSRTLRHYDAVGLLTPARVGAGGRRYYEHEHLLRLQQILLLRELGLGLDAIAGALRQQTAAGTVRALRRHRDLLVSERERLGRLLSTVETTIETLEKGEEMAPQEIFEGFGHSPYEEEARQRWGDEAVDAASERMRQWSPDDAELARTGFARVHSGLAPLLAQGVPPDDDRVQELVDLHYRVNSLFWTANADAYRGLGQMYVEDERFHETIGGASLAAYLRDAIAVYAERRLESAGSGTADR